jgi:putative membrane protein insertion efficiency factor
MGLLCAVAGSRLHAADATSVEETAAGDPAIGAIRFYQRYLSSLHHSRCRFTPSCSEYAAQAIATYGLPEGSARAADRLMRCNASASGTYPRDARGSLDDPVDGAMAAPASLRVPRWLLPAPEPDDPPVAGALTPARLSRLSETLDFARVLERRGDCESASTEYQRAGSLADTLAADAWAFARTGACHFTSSQWPMAERAYLSAALLGAGGRRATAAYSAAASRFNSGAFAACGRLLEDPVFAAMPASGGANSAHVATPGGDPGGSGSAAIPPGDGGASALDAAGTPGTTDVADPRVATLSGLCAFAGGDWPRARSRFEIAAASGDSALAARGRRLAAFAGEGPALPHRSPGWAGALSAILPGAGQVYCGRMQDGLRHLLFNGALIYSVVLLAQGDNVPAAVIVAGVTLPFYTGNILGARDEARRFDRRQRLGLMEQALAETAR